jgi:pseudaminic acid synthase
MRNLALTIGGKPVGMDHPPLILAEMSGNHGGSLESALRIVRMAAESGADAIKLQTFTPGTLTIDSTRPEFFIDDPDSTWHGRRLWELYGEAHTPWEWHRPIFELARSRGMACISSAFDDSSLRYLLDLGVDALKIASFELVHIPLIEAAARSGKPVLLSTGMACKGEIDDAVAALDANGCNDFILLKCTSAYPSSEKDANVLTMQDMRARYGCNVGLSDHSLRPYAAYAAVALGATIVEKHVTLSRAGGGVDAAFSLEPPELGELVKGVKLVWQSRGDVHYDPMPVEAASLKERPSIYVVRPVRKGQNFTAENVRIIRPANGLAPKHYRLVIGRPATRDIDAGVPLSWDLVDVQAKDELQPRRV